MGQRLVMNLSILLLASFSVFFIPACFGQVAVDTSGMSCSGLDMSNGEYKTIITWECFANNTKACVTRTEDCSKCDGTFSMASSTHTFPDEEAVDDAEEAKEDEKEKEYKEKDEKDGEEEKGEDKEEDKEKEKEKEDKAEKERRFRRMRRF